MADNTVLNPGASGDTIRDLARQAGTIKTQVVQLDIGGATANAEVLVTAGQQAMAASLPVVIASNQSAIPISAASLPLPTGASTETTLTSLNGKVTAVNTGAVTISTALPAGANNIGSIVQQPLTKGTQGANGVSTQDLKDAGRNQTNYFMAAQVLSTAAEVLQSLTGYKGGAAVAATTTPAVVTAAKTYRITRIVITYVGVLAAGSISVNLRANLAGVVALASPLVDSWLVGANAAVAGVAETIVINIPDGMEFPAGTGIGVGVVGQSAVGAAAATGYAKVSVSGYEY